MKRTKEDSENDRKQISDIVDKTGQLLPAFEMAYNKGNLDLFKEFIHQHKLQETFLQNSLNDLLKIVGDKNKIFTKIVEEEGLEYFNKIYGNEFGEKLKNAYEEGKINFMDIFQISNINKSNNIKEQVNIMIKMLELCEDDNLEIGIHRTGGAVGGESLNKEGIKLTGNINSSGVMNISYNDIMERLEDNISFDNHLGTLLFQIVNGGSWKNYFGKKFIDIAIVAIPKSKLEKSSEEELIIKYKGNYDRLNPKFIKGYITVDAQNDTLEQYVENPIYFSKDHKSPSNILKQTIEDSKTKVVFSRIQQLIEKIKEKIKSKDKNTSGVKRSEGNR